MLRKFLKGLWTGLALMFKKSSQVTPASITNVEATVVQEKKDNYFAETMQKSYGQHLYEQQWKKLDPEQQKNSMESQQQRFNELKIKSNG